MSTTVHGRRSFPSYPNPRSYSIDPTQIVSKFVQQFVPLDSTDKFKSLSADIFEIDKLDYCYIPQDDPRWLALRGMPRITGSVLAKLLGFHDILAAKYLDLPVSMYVTDPINEAWEEYLCKIRYGYVPSTPLDPPGNVHAANGKLKEDSVFVALMSIIPPMKLHEVGMTTITPEHLAEFRPVNVFSESGNEEITELPFEMGITPDFRGHVPVSIFREGDKGQHVIFAGDMIEVVGECKVSTCYSPQSGESKSGIPHLFGASYGFYKPYPYKYPKPYYVPQLFGEMLATGLHTNLFCSWTYGNGMNLWKVEMRQRYLSLMLSMLIHLHSEFIAKNMSVPTDYFMKHPDKKIHLLYMELLDLTKDIVNNTPFYFKAKPEETMKASEDYGVIDRKSFVEFPNITDSVMPLHQLLFMYGCRLLHDPSVLTWTTSWKQVSLRLNNMHLIASCEYLRFCDPMITMIMEDKDLYMIGKNRDIDGRHLDAVQNKMLCAAEDYVFRALKKLCACYGNPAFPAPADVEREKEEIPETMSLGTLFHHLVIEAISMQQHLAKALDGFDVGDDPEIDFDNFNPLDHMNVFSDQWATEIETMLGIFTPPIEGRMLLEKPILANDEKMLQDRSLFPRKGSTNDPYPWQYMRVLALLVTADRSDLSLK